MINLWFLLAVLATVHLSHFRQSIILHPSFLSSVDRLQKTQRRMTGKEDLDYESLGDNSTMAQNAMAGALAGIGEHCLMYPIDSIKTRMQVLAPHAKEKAWKQQKNLWRGVYSVVMGAGPAHAVHFATYEYCKDHFNSKLNAFGILSSQEKVRQSAASAAAGACATLAHDCLMTPFDVIKQRMQLEDSTYRSVRSCARAVYRAEGMAAFYISLPTTLSMSIPFQSIQFATYEFFRTLIHPQGDYNPTSHVVAGALAGGFASSITTPLDVIKTLLQTRGSSLDPRIRQASGFCDAAKIIYERDSYRGFFRGFRPRILTHMPSTAISWSVYEYFKWFLSSEA